MMERPSLRPISCLRAACKITCSLHGNTLPSARSRAILNAGHSFMTRHRHCSRRPGGDGLSRT